MIHVILAIGVMLFTIKEIAKYGNSGISSNDATNSRCGHKQDKGGCKSLVNAYIINEKCEHIDVMMKDIIEVQDESEIYGDDNGCFNLRGRL